MNVISLVKTLNPNYNCTYVSQSPEKELTHFAMYTEALSTASPSCLYITLPKPGLDEMLPCNITLLIVGSSDHFLDCLNDITSLFFEEQNVEEQFQHFLSDLKGGESFAKLVDLASVFLDRSLVLIDLSFHVIAHSVSRPITDGIWQNNIVRGYCTYEFINAVNQLMPDNVLMSATEPVLINCTASQENKLCCCVFSGHQPIGYLVLLDNGKGVLPKHTQYMSRICQTISMMLGSHPELYSKFSGFTEDFLINLLNGNFNDDTEKELEQKGIRFPQAMKCVVIYPKNKSKHDLFYIRRELKNLFPLGFIFTYESSVIAVISDERDIETISSTDLINVIRKIGVSLVFRKLRKLSKEYDYARTACILSDKLNSGDKIVYYKDYQCYHILTSCSDPQILRDYIHPAINQLRSYDLAHNSQLLSTLKTYVDSNLSVKLTASTLFLHRNTLTYRINKIREVSGIDFENIDELIRLKVSFAAINIL